MPHRNNLSRNKDKNKKKRQRDDRSTYTIFSIKLLLLSYHSNDPGLRHFIVLGSSNFEHVQVRMPWHFPESRRFRLVRGWNFLVGIDCLALLD